MYLFPSGKIYGLPSGALSRSWLVCLDSCALSSLMCACTELDWLLGFGIWRDPCADGEGSMVGEDEGIASSDTLGSNCPASSCSTSCSPASRKATAPSKVAGRTIGIKRPKRLHHQKIVFNWLIRHLYVD